jgi:mannose-6-phosphate isomerase
MGAHPSAPAAVVRDGERRTLDAVIAADPDRELGPDCAARFGGRLPFLLKVLSAEKALSIQVHPSRAQAEAGFAAENARGLAAGDPARNYVDDWPKPELLCALTPFEVLAGMRTPADAAALLDALRVDRLRPLAADLASPGAGPQAPGRALESILCWPAGDRTGLIDDVVAACSRVTSGPYEAACAAVRRIAADHRGDIGIVAALLLRHAVLQPGEAVFMPAGGLHAYLHGTGIELLANSDNVVRAGLTGKHIDVPELLKLLDPAAAVPERQPVMLRDGVLGYGAQVPEFRLYRLDPGDDTMDLPGTGPRILLCTEGALVLRNAAGESAKLGRGESCFVSAADGDVSGSGPARVFLATVGVP